MDEYQKQAINFLKTTNSSISIEFLKHGFHFHNDKEKRDIYYITISKGSRKYEFNFGQSLNDSGFYFTMGKRRVDLDRKFLEVSKSQLTRHIKRNINYDYLDNGKSDKIHYPQAPSEYSILAAITKYDPGTFEEFCEEYGYDINSKSADKIYLAVKDEWNHIQALYTDEELELLREIN